MPLELMPGQREGTGTRRSPFSTGTSDTFCDEDKLVLHSMHLLSPFSSGNLPDVKVTELC